MIHRIARDVNKLKTDQERAESANNDKLVFE